MHRHLIEDLSHVRDPNHAFVHMIKAQEIGLTEEMAIKISAETPFQDDFMETLNTDESQFGNMLMSILQLRYQQNFDQLVKNGDIVQLDFLRYRNDGKLIYNEHGRKITWLDTSVDEYGSLPENFTIMDFPVNYWEGRIDHNSYINLGPEITNAFSQLTIDQIQQIGYKDFRLTVLDKVDGNEDEDLEQEGFVFYFVHFLINNKDYYVFADHDREENIDIKQKFLQILKTPSREYGYEPLEYKLIYNVDNFIYSPYFE